MKTIYLSLRGDPSGGGPSVFCFKMANELVKRGYKVIYDNPQKSDIALCIIESGKTFRIVDTKKTKVVVRLDGAYFKEYWHGKTSDRAWRPDMTALHNAIKRDVEKASLMIYQSQFSKNLIDAEIANRNTDFAIIHNGANTNIFKPISRLNDGFVNLFSAGKMRNGYLMESLIGTYIKLKEKQHKVRLILAGSMDNECLLVYNKYKGDSNIKHLGSFPNTKLNQAYAMGDIFLAPRMGSSSDNTISEAQSCGLPVIIPKWSGNVEMVEDGVSGIIVDSEGHWNYGEEYDAKLANSIETMMPKLNEFKKKAREYAVKNLSVESMVDKYLNVMGL